MASNLSLAISCDKREYKIGDTINIQYILMNNSKENVTFLPWGKHYTTNWILFYGSGQEEIKPVKLIVFELEITPDKDDFITIPSGARINYTFKGEIKKGDLKYLGSAQKYNGLFVDFGDSAYLLNGIGEFTIKGVYKIEQDWIESADKLLITNLWQRDIESNEVKIIIRGE